MGCGVTITVSSGNGDVIYHSSMPCYRRRSPSRTRREPRRSHSPPPYEERWYERWHERCDDDYEDGRDGHREDHREGRRRRRHGHPADHGCVPEDLYNEKIRELRQKDRQLSRAQVREQNQDIKIRALEGDLAREKHDHEELSQVHGVLKEKLAQVEVSRDEWERWYWAAYSERETLRVKNRILREDVREWRSRAERPCPRCRR